MNKKVLYHIDKNPLHVLCTQHHILCQHGITQLFPHTHVDTYLFLNKLSLHTYKWSKGQDGVRVEEVKEDTRFYL